MVSTQILPSSNNTYVGSTNLYPLANEDIAGVLEEVADLLEAQEANPFRVRSYWEGAQTIRQQELPVIELLRVEGSAGLEKLPQIGKSLAAAIAELAHTGRLQLLDRLRAEARPEDLFSTIPGIGKELARHVRTELGIKTLEQLELSAHDGSLANVSGFGRRRVRLVRVALAGMLGKSARRYAHRIGDRASVCDPLLSSNPSVGLLLVVDDRYRRLAKAGKLHTITPRRFNAEGKRWLPIMHWGREGWNFTALFSNTGRAHQLGKTHDWVVIFYERAGREGQCTVVTETRGPLTGRRVVRGREGECQ